MKQNLLSKAIAIATQAHHGQFDKQGVPYIMHPLQVMKNLNSDDEELNCIAILHDVVEDTAITSDDLAQKGMTNRIVDGVILLTKTEGIEYEQYINTLIQNEDAIRVKLADLEHNMNPKRIKGTTPKDIARMEKYIKTYAFLKSELVKKGN